MDPPWDLLVTFHSSAKSTPGCSQEHYLSTWPSQSTPWALLESSSKFLASSWGFLKCHLVTFHSSAKRAPGCSQEHYLSTWPSQSPPWALPVPSSKFLTSSWGFLVCLKNSLKQRVWSTWPSRSPPWTPTLDPPRSFCFVL